CLAFPGTALTQALPTPSRPVDLTSHGLPSTDRSWLPGVAPDTRDTPTTRRQRIGWIVALKAEAMALQARDGGKLTPDHRAYIQRRLARFLES
ncbi:hypothetical protein ACTGUT_12425, partial [Streptococcus suis]